MRTRAFTIYLVLTSLALFAIGFALDARAAQPTWEQRFERVKYRSLEGSDDRYSHRELQLAVHAADVHFGTPEGYHICVIDRESGWGINADNPTSSAKGLLQFLKSTWLSVRGIYRREVDRPNLAIKPTAGRVNPRAAIIVSAWLMRSGYSSHWGGCP